MGVSLLNLITQSSNTVVLTGAGMSTASGIPDFQDGIWKDKDPVELSSVETLNKDPEKVISFWGDIAREINGHEPNEGHIILARLHRLGLVDAIITQNVDGYHQTASKMIGSKGHNIIELHGNVNEQYCIKCATKFNGGFSLCPHCGGWVRPGITLYGEDLDNGAVEGAYNAIMGSELVVVLGSSLTVSPAVDLILHAISDGKKVVIVNNSETALDKVAYGIVRSDITQVLSSVYARLKKGI